MRRAVVTALLMAALALACREPDAAPPRPDLVAAERAGYRPLSVERERARGWRTEFGRRSVELDDVFSADLPLDAIPAVAAPRFVSVAVAGRSLAAEAAVVVVGERAYPVALLKNYELVNDVVDGRPIAVTYCSLCDSPMVYERTVDGRTVELGVSGFLRRGNALLYDRDTMSLWQQLTGEALIGAHTGAVLAPVPASVSTLAAFASALPEGEVWRAPAERFEPRVRTPGAGYDALDREPTHLFTPSDPRLPAMQRVYSEPLTSGVRVRSLPSVAEGVPLPRVVGGTVTFLQRAASPFDDARSVYYANVFERAAAGRTLSFEGALGATDTWRDRETGSRWNALGVAIEGPLEGTRLRPRPTVNGLWYAVAALEAEAAVVR